MKNSESIFDDLEIRHSLAYAIYGNIHTRETQPDYTEWLVAFSEVSERIENEEVDKEGWNSEIRIFSFIDNEKGNHQHFFEGLFNKVFELEEKGLIGNSDIFIGEMFAWVLDPVRFNYIKNKEDNALESVNFILNRKNKVIRYNQTLKRYVFDSQPENTPIDKDALYFYGDKIFITNGLLKYRKSNNVIETIKTTPVDIKVLTLLRNMGEGNLNNWLKKEELSSKLNITSGTLSNSFTSLRGISKIVGIDLIEDRGPDAKGKEFRINPKVLPSPSPSPKNW